MNPPHENFLRMPLFESIADAWKRRCYTRHVMRCGAQIQVHHHSLLSVHYQAQYNAVSSETAVSVWWSLLLGVRCV